MLVVDGSLEDIAFHNHIVLRAVQFVHRDRYWRRIEPTLQAFECSGEADRYRAHWTLRYIGRECDLSAAHVLKVTDGEVTVLSEVTARAPTVTNRTGFILLHPARATAGRSVAVTHPDGNVTRETFPQSLSPHPVLSGIAALEFPADVAPGFRIELSGDVFETEDQRNWTDCSFKTFSRPLSEPIPYTIEPGSPIRQTVRISAGPSGEPPGRQTTGSRPRSVDLARKQTLAAAFARPDGEPPVVHASVRRQRNMGRMPRLGLGVHYERASANDAMVEALRTLRPSLLQLRLNPTDAMNGVESFAQLARQAGADAAFELTTRYKSGENGGLNRAIDVVCGAGLAPPALTLYPETDAELATARADYPGHQIGGGTPLFFAFAHRAQLPNGLDFVQWCMPPGVHDIADRAVMETLGCVPDVLDCARRLWPDKPLWIGPNSLRPRFRPTTLDADIPPLNLTGRPDDVDPRQQRPFAAAWTLGFISRLAYGGADTILMFEPFGTRGVMDREPPDRAARSGGMSDIRTSPVYDVLLALAGARGCELVAVDVDHDDLVLGLAWSGSVVGAAFANLSPRSVHLNVAGAEDLPVRSVTAHQPEATREGGISMSAFEVVAFGGAEPIQRIAL